MKGTLGWYLLGEGEGEGEVRMSRCSGSVLVVFYLCCQCRVQVFVLGRGSRILLVLLDFTCTISFVLIWLYWVYLVEDRGAQLKVKV